MELQFSKNTLVYLLLNFIIFIHWCSCFQKVSFELKSRKLSILNEISVSTEPDHNVDEKFLRKTALLVTLWKNIAFPKPDTDSFDMKLSDFGLDRNDVKGLIDHFQSCRDCAADNVFLMATQDDDNNDIFRLSNVAFKLLGDVNDYDDEEEWGSSFDQSSLISDENEDSLTASNDENTVFPIELDDDIVLQDTKEWVRKMISDFGICPFTMGPDRAGIPMGGVRYRVSRARSADEAFYAYWEEVAGLLLASEKVRSTVLLIFPELDLFGNYELFESYCESLSDALCTSTMGAESELQLVFFHPKYQFRDGQMRVDEESSAANYARRSPWPMINILRTPQVRAAQKGVPTGQVYQQNEDRLKAVGFKTLQKMLTSRDWNDLPINEEKRRTSDARAAKALENRLSDMRAVSAGDDDNDSILGDERFADGKNDNSYLTLADEVEKFRLD